jgi:phage gp36-like protein
MAYTTQAKIVAKLPAQHLNDACDDDGDGSADNGVLDAVIAGAATAVDAYLAGLYSVPFADPAPAVCQEAALVFACETIYDRRQIVEKNPYKERADFWRDRLEKIGKGEIPLDASQAKEYTPGAAITEDVSVDDTMR